MAVNTVSSVDSEVWQLISTTTMAGATAYTLSSITGYKRLMVTVASGTKTGADYWTVRFNGDTTAGKYSGGASGSNTFHYIAGNDTTATAALVIIEDADKSVPHQLYIGSYVATIEATAGYVDPTPITSITIGTSGSSTLNSGTIRLYGIAA